ncbi:MAG: hypothetical protein AAF141_05375 [Pseudomonadota bacterium]
MKKIIIDAAAVIALVSLAVAGGIGSANAESRPGIAITTFVGVPAQTAGKPKPKPRDNVAHAWTSACYAEFGPNAKWPSPAGLEKCLAM